MLNKLVRIISLCLISLSLTAAKNAEVDIAPSPAVLALSLQDVLDGSTFVSGGQKIRLWGIRPLPVDDEHFLASRLFLEVLLEQAPFECYYKSKDKNGTFVMQCFSTGVDISSEMLRMGLAKYEPIYLNATYKIDEEFAREQKYGIWKYHAGK